MTKEPKISIITINYNDAIGLEETIVSVVNQSYHKIEYLVIDGGSNDKSEAIIVKYQHKITYWVSEADNGIYHAMNKGIERATGDYLLFLNSGDTLIDFHIIQKSIESGLTTDLVYGNLLLYNDNKEWVWHTPDVLTFKHFFRSTLPHPATFIKRTLFDLVGRYDETLSVVSDWKFFLLAVFKFYCSYKHIDATISHYNTNGISSQTENQNAITLERSAVLNEYFRLFVEDYENLEKLEIQAKKIKYFLKTRKFIKKILNQK